MARHGDPRTFDELFALSDERMVCIDIGRVNLLCAQGLPGAEDLDVESYVLLLVEWAARARRMTNAHLPVFRRNRGTFHNSEPLWRMLAMTRVLRDEYCVSYNMDRAFSEPDWADSRDLLIHGILGPRRTGTCASLPVLLVAIGRRLRYPLCLSHAPGHTFSRWDGSAHHDPGFRERLNIEFSGDMDVMPDEHYFDFPVHWPRWQREMHLRGDPRCEFLYSFTRSQEVAHSLCQRATCLEAIGRLNEAINLHYRADRLDGRWGGYKFFARRTLRLKAEQVMRSMRLDPAAVRRWALAPRIRQFGQPPVTVEQPATPPSPAAPLPAVVTLAAPVFAVFVSGREIRLGAAGPAMGATWPSMPPVRPLSPQHAAPPLPPIPPKAMSRLAAPAPEYYALSVETPGPAAPHLSDDVVQAVLLATCRDTPAKPTLDLLLEPIPEPKVDPYASMRDQNGRVRFPQPK